VTTLQSATNQPRCHCLLTRSLHRYYRPWLDAQSLVDAADGSGSKGLTYEGYRPQSGRDRSLTAFAQLATLRLNTRRAMVSLIDSNRQYILAEATRTLSLFTPSAEREEDEVWLGKYVAPPHPCIWSDKN
jgi:hypothetical protein